MERKTGITQWYVIVDGQRNIIAGADVYKRQVPMQQRMPATAKRDIMLAGLNFFIRAVVMARQAINRMMEKI